MRSLAEQQLAEFCAAYPLDDIDLDSGEPRQLRRFENLTHLATLLVGYDALRSQLRTLGLSRTLDHRRLAGVLMPRLLAFLRRLGDRGLRGQDATTARAVSRLFAFANDLLNHGRTREAVVCLQLYAQWPSTDGLYWLATGYDCLAHEERDGAALREARTLAEAMLSGRRPVALQRRPALERMLTELNVLDRQLAGASDAAAGQLGGQGIVTGGDRPTVTGLPVIKTGGRSRPAAPAAPVAGEGTTCPRCGVRVKSQHLARHESKCLKREQGSARPAAGESPMFAWTVLLALLLLEWYFWTELAAGYSVVMRVVITFLAIPLVVIMLGGIVQAIMAMARGWLPRRTPTTAAMTVAGRRPPRHRRRDRWMWRSHGRPARTAGPV